MPGGPAVGKHPRRPVRAVRVSTATPRTARRGQAAGRQRLRAAGRRARGPAGRYVNKSILGRATTASAPPTAIAGTRRRGRLRSRGQGSHASRCAHSRPRGSPPAPRRRSRSGPRSPAGGPPSTSAARPTSAPLASSHSTWTRLERLRGRGALAGDRCRPPPLPPEVDCVNIRALRGVGDVSPGLGRSTTRATAG
jgi:hypothetical protein